MYSFIVIISSTNKYRKQKQYVYLSDEMVTTQTFTIARWQIVVKNQRQQNKPKTGVCNKNKAKNKQNKKVGGGG